jgi:hypothetical protein
MDLRIFTHQVNKRVNSLQAAAAFGGCRHEANGVRLSDHGD